MIKRQFDVLCASISLIILFPIIILIVCVLYLFQNRPIFFVQERIGRNGKPFNIYKFRSMQTTSEDRRDRAVSRWDVCVFGDLNGYEDIC